MDHTQSALSAIGYVWCRSLRGEAHTISAKRSQRTFIWKPDFDVDQTFVLRWAAGRSTENPNSKHNTVEMTNERHEDLGGVLADGSANEVLQQWGSFKEPEGYQIGPRSDLQPGRFLSGPRIVHPGVLHQYLIRGGAATPPLSCGGSRAPKRELQVWGRHRPRAKYWCKIPGAEMVTNWP